MRKRVIYYITQVQWSPEQIAGRLAHERSATRISYNTIYRGIYLGNLSVPFKTHGARGLPRQLGHQGKTRQVNGAPKETRGCFNDVPSIHDRPVSAESRR